MKKTSLQTIVSKKLTDLMDISFEQAEAYFEPVQELHGVPGSIDFYQLDIRVIERVIDTSGEWLKLTISANDGSTRFGMINNVIGAIAVYRQNPNEILG